MNIFSYLKLPSSICFDKKITKTAILADNKLSVVEKKLLSQISTITIKAIINPDNYTILSYTSDEEIYKEILIIQIELKTKVDTEKINKFIQRLIPRPVILIMLSDEEFSMGMANKKVNQVDNSKRIVSDIESLPWLKKELYESFFKDLNTSNFSHQNLKTFYKSFIQRLQSLQLAIINDTIYQSYDLQTIEQKRKVLQGNELVGSQIKKLQKQLKQTDSFSEKVSINQEIQKLKLYGS